MSPPSWMESLEQAVRYAFRTMRKTPVFTAAVTLTIALAIGANTVIFSVVDAVMLRALPFREPERVLQIGRKTTSSSSRTSARRC